MQLRCEKCGALIPATSINIQEQIAVCSQCNSVFSFAGRVARKSKQRKVKQPDRVMLTETDDSVEIQFRWLHVMKWYEHWITALLIIGFASFVGSALGIILNGGVFLALTLGLGLSAGAAFCLYLLILTLVNQIRITMDETTIGAEHTPMPLWGTHSADPREVVRVYCQPNRTNSSTSNYYNVQLVLYDEREITLVNLPREIAFYVQQTVEAYLEGDTEELPQDDEALEDVGEAAISSLTQSSAR
jgi:DNA-directed RNA polymerase subunit M/transcription elongation factor TFIIS